MPNFITKPKDVITAHASAMVEFNRYREEDDECYDDTHNLSCAKIIRNKKSGLILSWDGCDLVEYFPGYIELRAEQFDFEWASEVAQYINKFLPKGISLSQRRRRGWDVVNVSLTVNGKTIPYKQSIILYGSPIRVKTP